MGIIGPITSLAPDVVSIVIYRSVRDSRHQRNKSLRTRKVSGDPCT
jgi:hypothetical protein